MERRGLGYLDAFPGARLSVKPLNIKHCYLCPQRLAEVVGCVFGANRVPKWLTISHLPLVCLLRRPGEMRDRPGRRDRGMHEVQRVDGEDSGAAAPE
jgi:hypothetical protein